MLFLFYIKGFEFKYLDYGFDIFAHERYWPVIFLSCNVLFRFYSRGYAYLIA